MRSIQIKETQSTKSHNTCKCQHLCCQILCQHYLLMKRRVCMHSPFIFV